MVASVGSSYNVLTLFQAGTDSPSAPKQEAVDAIIEKVRQLKAESSPAYVQATSFATDAWISGSEEGEAVTEAETSQTASDATATNSGSGSSITMIGSFDSLFRAVARYNDWLTSQDGVQASLDSYKAQLSSATDSGQQEKLTGIVKTIEALIPRNAEKYQELGRQISAYQSQNGYSIAGNLVEMQDDGTFKIGVFSVSSDGKKYYEHDGSGTAVQYNNSGVVRTTYELAAGTNTDTGVGFW